MTDTAAARIVDEEGLVARARAGDRRSQEELVSRHLRSVYEVAYRILGDPDAAEDATQDTFVQALRGLESFRGDARFRTWLLRIAANTARSAGRRHTRRREVALGGAGEWLEGRSRPETEAVTRTEVERVQEAVRRLPEKQRLAVSLRLYQDLSYREIAEITGSSEGSARVNYHLGVKRLREWFQ